MSPLPLDPDPAETAARAAEAEARARRSGVAAVGMLALMLALCALVLTSAASHAQVRRRELARRPSASLRDGRYALPPGHPPLDGQDDDTESDEPRGQLPPGHPPLDLAPEPALPGQAPRLDDDAVLPPGHPHVPGLRHRGLVPSDYI